MFRLRILSYVTRKTFQNGILKEDGRKYQHIFVSKLKTCSCAKYLTSNKKFFSHASNPADSQTEQDFLVRLKNDPDTFGDSSENTVLDEMDQQEERYFQQQASPSRKLSTKQYADMIKALIRKRKIKEAIDILEVRMIKEDQVKPEGYIYNLLLGACGQVGYTKKAFSLYNQMKKRGLKVMGATYTSLFNACANSPWPEDGLSRAKHLRNIMVEKMYEPNPTNYNAMVKAFGRCGDLPTAFSLVDEMSVKKIQIKDDTINFLLQACIQDKEAGFRHALLVWRKMIDKNIAPSLYTYNLLVRCVRDCGMGNIEVTKQTLNVILKDQRMQINTNDSKLLVASSRDGKALVQNYLPLCIDSGNETNESKHIISVNNKGQTIDDTCRPNLLAKVPHLGNIISLSEITKAEDRLLLIGGYKSLLMNMTENNCTPDIKTFTILLDSLPGSLLAEKELQSIMKKYKVKPDIDFFNMLIKKRSMRFDYESAKTVLEDMQTFNLRPNLITYGVLALGCKTKNEALELINEMKEHSYRLNTEILGAMLHQACHHKNFAYVLAIMELSLKETVKPNQIFINCLDDFKKSCKQISNDKENTLSQNPSFQKGFIVFKMRYKTWLEEIEVDKTEEAHPWTQYRQTVETDTRHYKDKSAAKFKPVHLSRFKVKTYMKRK